MTTRRRPALVLLSLLMFAVAGLAACEPGQRTVASAGQTAVAAARQQLGQPYVYGGESRAEGGFDCSGLTYYAWKQAGVTLPRTSSAQYGFTQRITKAQLQPGDLVFYSASGSASSVSHVAMYAGGGKIIHARKPGVPVREDVLDSYWVSNRVGYGRIPASKLPA